MRYIIYNIFQSKLKTVKRLSTYGQVVNIQFLELQALRLHIILFLDCDDSQEIPPLLYQLVLQCFGGDSSSYVPLFFFFLE